MKKQDLNKIDLSKKPYRGICSEIAKEQNYSRQAVWNAIYTHQNPRILEIVLKKMKERQLEYEKQNANTNKVIKEIFRLSEAV